jgi:hypothetical protein
MTSGRPRFRPVFTPAGAAVLVIALVILVRSLLARNSYEIILSSFTLLLLLFLAVFGIWKSRKLKSMETLWKTPFPMTAASGEKAEVSGLEARIPLFFRLHFFVRGRFFPSGSVSACRVSSETSVPRGEKTARLPLDFPMSGVFQGEGFCRLVDIFGFYSFSCGIPQSRTVNIRSAPCFGKELFINAQSGAEDRRNKTSSDEERYYMREYTPGDRFRDINWKSSEKIDALITRISPDNQEKVSRIDVYFRNYGPADKSSLEALWLLDRAKARLSYFLRNLKEQQSSYIFRVRAASGTWEIEDEEDLDAFLEELAAVSFSPPRNETAEAGAGELFVFSTSCDAGLPGFLLACSPRPVSLFLAQSGEAAELETLRIRDFPAKGCIPSRRLLVRGKIKRLGVQANRIEMIYAETKI